jgi:xanthine/CO dehydrogenase XdhC/CoxF family maturation factor
LSGGREISTVVGGENEYQNRRRAAASLTPLDKPIGEDAVGTPSKISSELLCCWGQVNVVPELFEPPDKSFRELLLVAPIKEIGPKILIVAVAR